MRATVLLSLLAGFALSDCAHTPRIVEWACVSEQREGGFSFSSVRMLGPSGASRSVSHRWWWNTGQAGVWVTIQQEVSGGAEGAGDDTVLISVNAREMRSRVRAIELRAGSAGEAIKVAAQRSSRADYQHNFRTSLASIQQLANAGARLEMVLLDSQGQALQSIPLDPGVVVRARAGWQIVIARTLEMSRNFSNECYAEFDPPIVIT